MKHTPGPWSIRYLSGLDMEIFSEHGRICSFSGFSHSIELMDEHEAEEKANAKLIAAAPELLDALETMFLRLQNIDFNKLSESHYDYEILSAVFDGTFKQAKEAINKAKGLPQQG